LDCCRETVRGALKRQGFSWKKWRKLLNKANPKQREAFIAPLKAALETATQGKGQVVYVDEAHIHLDTDEGYGWTVKGERAWISSSSPGLAKVSFYGVYFYNRAQVQLYPSGKANGDSTVEVFGHIKASLAGHDDITLIWDNAPYHRSRKARQAAADLGVKLLPLPAYSPDFMPVEHLWQWFREDVTYHTCYDQESKLLAQAKAFQEAINTTPLVVSDRFWVRGSLDPSEEKLRFSA
jgi:transposase